MKKLFAFILLIAGLASGQTYNVAITNSLLGPVDLTVQPTVTNGISFNGDFTFVTNLYFQAQGLNVVTPTTESTNISGTWTITIGTNSAAMLYTQTGAITSIVTALGSNVTTNDVALAFVGLRGNGSSVTWPTSQWVWASGTAPTVTSNQWNMYYIQLWKNERHVVTIGDTP